MFAKAGGVRLKSLDDEIKVVEVAIAAR